MKLDVAVTELIDPGVPRSPAAGVNPTDISDFAD